MHYLEVEGKLRKVILVEYPTVHPPVGKKKKRMLPVCSESKEREATERTYFVIKFSLWMLNAQLIHQHTLILGNNSYGYFSCNMNE